MQLKETNDIVELLTYDLNPDANVIWGARINDDFDGKVRVTAILTGVEPKWVFGGMYNRKGQNNRAPSRIGGDKVDGLIPIIGGK